MSGLPKAEVQISAESRTLRAKLREARAEFGKFGTALRKEVFGKVLFDGPKASAHMFGQLGASAVSSGLGALADQARDVFAFNEQLTRLQITASKTPEEMAAFGAAVRTVSGEVGISAREILAGAQAYVALTGDADGASSSLRTWARVAQATGATVETITKTAAAMKQQLDIKPAQMEEAFSALAAQGKEGAIELKDLSEQLSSIAPQWAEFKGGKGMQGLKEMGAMFQMAKRGFGGDAGETATGLQSFLNALIKNAPKIQAMSHVKMFEKDPKTGTKELRNVFEILDDISNSKLAKDPYLVEKALGRVEAYRTLLQVWKDSRTELREFVKIADNSGVIQADLATYTSSAAGRTAIAMERAKNAIAEAFTPERIEKFVGLLEGMADKAGAAAEALGKAYDVISLPYRAGQWIAGKFSFDGGNVNQNPWAEEVATDKRVLAGRGGGGVTNLDRLDGIIDPARLRAMRLRNANKEAYDAEVKELVNGGDPDKTTKVGVEQAVVATHLDKSLPGNAGRIQAAERYLESAHVSKERADVIYAEQVKSLQGLVDNITKAIKEGFKDAKNEVKGDGKTEVKVDGKTLVTAHRNSSAHAGRPGG